MKADHPQLSKCKISVEGELLMLMCTSVRGHMVALCKKVNFCKTNNQALSTTMQ